MHSLFFFSMALDTTHVHTNLELSIGLKFIGTYIQYTYYL